MSEPRIIRADYASWRPVTGRKVLQLIFEIPLEETELAMKMLGVPMPGESKWCAVALLENGSPASGNGAGTHTTTPRQSGNSDAATTQHGERQTHITANTAAVGTSETQKERRAFTSLPLSQQAAMRCGDRQFIDFLTATYTDLPDDFDPADALREICLVGSRKEFDQGGEGAMRWAQVERRYQSWLTDQRYAEAAR